MSKFIPLQFLGSAEEINTICEGVVETLLRDFGLKISQKEIIPAVVDTFIDAAIYESLQFKRNEVKSELNLFNTLRIIHELVPTEDKIASVISLGRMGMRKLDMEFSEESEDEQKIETNIADIDIKLLEKISMRASGYLEERHNLPIRDYQIIFKIAEVFFSEMISHLKLATGLNDAEICIFDQFTILLDENGRYESISINENLDNVIKMIYTDRINDLDRLDMEDDAAIDLKKGNK